MKRTRARQSLPPPAECRRIREAAGASIAEIARAIQVTPQAVWAWETGKTQPNATNLVAYVDLLADLREVTAA